MTTNPAGGRPERSAVWAVGGKGGAGKTTFTGIAAKILSGRGRRILAVDADPPMSLAFALGAKPAKTIGEMRNRLIEDPRERRKLNDSHTREVLRNEILVTLNGVDLLVLGSAEGPGCYCGLNELLKFGIESLAEEYEITLIDCEAGIEQVNRRVISSLGTLIMISDATVKGLQTAAQLKSIAGQHGVARPHRTGLVINRAGPGLDDLVQRAQEMGLDVLGVIPVDENVAEFDRLGRPTIELPHDSPSVNAVRQVLEKLELTG